jgi:hypothetical protein
MFKKIMDFVSISPKKSSNMEHGSVVVGEDMISLRPHKDSITAHWVNKNNLKEVH